jgi:hypothetical protein
VVKILAAAATAVVLTCPEAETPVTFTLVPPVKSQPVLFPLSTQPFEVNEFHVAPPVAAISLIAQKLTFTVPDALESVARVPEVLLFIVMRLPEVPARLKPEVNVVVVLDGKVMVAGCVVLLMSANVFAPVIVSAPAPPWLRVQLKVDPPPAKVLAVAAVKEMMPVPVPAVVVNPVGFALLNAVPDTLSASVPPLNVIFLVPAFVWNAPAKVRVLPFRSTVPFVRANVLLDVSAPDRTTELLSVLSITMGRVKVTPFIFMDWLFDPVNVTLLAAPDNVMPVPIKKSP